MRKKKCVTGCSTRTYREDILLLLNCIAENCGINCEYIMTCVAATVAAARGIVYDAETNELSVAVSEMDGNVLSLQADGLYGPTPVVPSCEDIQDCVGAGMSTTTGLLYDDDENTFSVALSDVLSNAITQTPTGLYVSPGAISCMDAQDCVGATVEASRGITYDGALHELSVAVSADAGNQLTIESDGLFVPTPTINGCEAVQDCVGNAVDPSRGLEYDDASNQFSVAISATVGNQLTQEADGLSVAALSCEAVQDCVGTAVAASRGISYSDVSNQFTVALSASAGNALTLNADGVFAATSSHAVTSTSATFAPALNISSLGTYTSGVSGTLTLNNPSSVRTFSTLAAITWVSQLIFQTTGVWDVKGQLSINGGAYATTVTTRYGSFPGLIGLPAPLYQFDAVSLAAGGSRSWAMRVQVVTVVASAVGSSWTSSAVAVAVIGAN